MSSIDAKASAQRLADALRAFVRVKVTDEMRDNAQLIIEECERQSVNMREQVAYVLGTAWHESYLLPVVEKRAAPGTDVWRMQERYWHTGYYGRGFVQLTWRRNYERFGALLNVDLVNNPDLALQQDIAAKVLVIGMRDGLFTGKRLSHYFRPGKTPLWYSARQIVNGLFHADKVAHAAKVALQSLVKV